MKANILSNSLTALIAGMFVLSGCSTVESRKTERADSFSKLSQSEQQEVMKGRISNGMSEDAVYIALGRPMRKVTGQMNDKVTVTWVYGRLETYTNPAYRYSSYGYYDRRCSPGPVYVPEMETRVRDSFLVFFQQGRVTGWQEL